MHSAFLLLVFYIGAHRAVGEYTDTMEECQRRAWTWAWAREDHDLRLGRMPSIVVGPLGAADGNLNALCYKVTEAPKGLLVISLRYDSWTPPWVRPPQVAWAK
jgi:hypothetical protein